MATLTSMFFSIPVIVGSVGSALGIVVVLLIVAAAIAFAVLYSTNEEFKEKVTGTLGSSGASSKPLRNVIRPIGTKDFNSLMASIGSYLTGRGYVPQSQAPGLYVYQKQEHQKPSAIVAILLFFICFIPGVIYLAKGGGVKTSIVTIQVGKTEGAYHFDIKAPAGVRRRIYGFLQPYLIPVETATPVSASQQSSKEASPAPAAQEVTPQPPAAESIAPTPEAPSSRCSYCGEVLGPKAKFCSSCGTTVAPAE